MFKSIIKGRNILFLALAMVFVNTISYAIENYDAGILFIADGDPVGPSMQSLSTQNTGLMRCNITDSCTFISTSDSSGIGCSSPAATGCSSMPSPSNMSTGFNVLPPRIQTMIYGNTNIFTGLNDGRLQRCPKDGSAGCDVLAGFTTKQVITPINKMIQAFVPTDNKVSLYVGLDTGKVWKCDPNAKSATKENGKTISSSCGNSSFYNVKASINDMIYANGQVYIGTINGLWKCDPSKQNSCLSITPGQESGNKQIVDPVNSLAYADFDDGRTKKCMWA